MFPFWSRTPWGTQFPCLPSPVLPVTIPQPFLFFIILTLLKRAGQLFCKRSPTLGCVWCILMMGMRVRILVKCTIEMASCPSWCFLSGDSWCLSVLLPVMLTLTTWLKWSIGLNWWTQKREVHILVPRTCERYVIWGRKKKKESL